MTASKAPSAEVHGAGSARGRDRVHLYPGRLARLAPRFTDEELSEIRAAAATAGLTPTGFCAEATLGAARGARPSSLDVERLIALQVELFDARVAVGRIGTNLNQAVAALNATGVPPDSLQRAAELCERRMARIDELIETIGAMRR